MKSIKKGAKVNGLRPEILMGWDIAESVYNDYGVACVLTEGTGGKHSRGSLHYVGQAIDLRTREFTSQAIKQSVAQEIQELLGDEYDVVLESDHIHLEFQPK